MLRRTPPRFVLFLWPLLDKLLRWRYHIKPLKSQADSIISLDLWRYRGRPFRLNDGSEVKGGDRIIELHLNSNWFKKRRQSSPLASDLPGKALHSFTQDLSHLARQLAEGTLGHNITALHGITFFHTAARRLGFQTEELPETLWKRGAQFYLTGLRQVLNPWRKERVEARRKPLELKGIWLSRAELLRRYGPASPSFQRLEESQE